MGLLSKAMSKAKKGETEPGAVGLLAKAGRYAEKGGGEGMPKRGDGEDVPVESAAEEEGTAREGGEVRAESAARGEEAASEFERMLFRPPAGEGGPAAGEEKKERKGLLRRALSLSGKRQGRRGRREVDERPRGPLASIDKGAPGDAGTSDAAGEAAAPTEASFGAEGVPSPGEEIGEIPIEEIANTIGGESGFEEPRTLETPGGEEPLPSAGGEAAPLEAPAGEASMGEAPEGETPVDEESFEAEEEGPSMSVEEISDFLGSIDTGKDFEHAGGSPEDGAYKVERADEKKGTRSGLLAKAAAYAEEMRGPRARVKKPSPARKKPSGRAPKAAKGAAQALKFAVAAPAGRKDTLPAPSREGRGELLAKAEEGKRPPAKLPAAGEAKPAAEVQLHPAPRVWEGDFTGYLARAVEARDALGVVELFNTVLDREGHASFILRLLDAMARAGKGKSAHLFVPSRGRYSVEFSVPDAGKKGAARKPAFPQDSRFIETLREAGEVPVRSTTGGGSKKAQQQKKDTAGLGLLAPWTAVSMPVGGELVAFVVIGKQPQKPKLDAKGLVFLGKLAAPYVNKYLLLNTHRQELAALEGEMREKEGILALYSAFDRRGDMLPDQLVKMLLEGISSAFGIESAVVLADWRAKGGYLPVAASGVPDKALGKYRLSKRDAAIQAIVDSGRAAIPPDSDKRLGALSKDREPWLNTYLVVPLRYNGEPVGLLTVHSMKGAGRKPSEKSLERLAHAARVLSPALLFGKLHAMSPFQVLDGLITRELLKAEKGRHELGVSVFTLERAKETFKSLGFDRYWAMVERLRRVVEQRAGSSGVVREIDWNRVALLMREDGGPGVEETIAGVRVDFLKSLTKSERALGVELSSLMTRYPRESRTPSEILYALI